MAHQREPKNEQETKTGSTVRSEFPNENRHSLRAQIKPPAYLYPMTNPPPSNFERMLALIDEVFATRSDPDQLQVDETVIEKLQAIHPATLGEYNEGNGPCVWVLVIPTTKEVMNDFLAGHITEQQLLDSTQPGQQFEALYLCSATVLPEYRRRELALNLCIDAVNAIQLQYPLQYLYTWPFTPEGRALAEHVAKKTGLTLFSLP